MDIQSIIKQVLNLSDIVIKNPSTSVQNSGIDLSTIMSLVTTFLGNKNGGAQQGGGLGSILGGLGGMLAGGAMQKEQPQQQAQQGGINMTDILGGLGKMMAQGNQQQAQPQQGGGIGDILGGLGKMMAGGSLQKEQPQQQAQQGGGFGDILGGLGKMMAGGQQQQSSDSGSLLGDLMGKASIIKNMLGGNSQQNLNNEQKGNLTDVLNIINVAKNFVK